MKYDRFSHPEAYDLVKGVAASEVGGDVVADVSPPRRRGEAVEDRHAAEVK